MHGPVIGTVTVDGQPYALTRQRSTFGRDGLNLAALKDMTDGDAASPGQFFDAADQFGFTFNWALRVAHAQRVLLVRTASSERRRGSTVACRRSGPASTSGAASSTRTTTRATSTVPTACC